MPKDTNGQGKLLQKVVSITEIRPQDKQTGQQKLFGQVEEFAPGFNEWAGMMDQMLHQTQSENKQLRQDVKETTAQTKRLANSLEAIIPQITQHSVDHAAPHIVFGNLPEGKDADVAIVDGMKVPSESLYILTTGDIVERVGNDNLTASFMGSILKWLGIFGDCRFHSPDRTGKKSFCQKYKPQVIDEIYRRIADPEAYGLDRARVDKALNYIRPKEGIGK